MEGEWLRILRCIIPAVLSCGKLSTRSEEVSIIPAEHHYLGSPLGLHTERPMD